MAREAGRGGPGAWLRRRRHGRLGSLLESARASLWIVPAAFGLAAVALAEVLARTDLLRDDAITVGAFGGDAEANKKLVMKLYDNGVLAFGAGKKPSRMRFLMPLGVVTTEDIDAVLAIFEQTMVEVAEDQAR